LQNEALRPQFDLLLSLGEGRKPFECVGDEHECRAAAHLAAQRADRLEHGLLRSLAQASRHVEPDLPGRIDALLSPIGPHHIPSHHAAAIGLG
jgi:hypothetical protein